MAEHRAYLHPCIYKLYGQTYACSLASYTFASLGNMNRKTHGHPANISLDVRFHSEPNISNTLFSLAKVWRVGTLSEGFSLPEDVCPVLWCFRHSRDVHNLGRQGVSNLLGARNPPLPAESFLPVCSCSTEWTTSYPTVSTIGTQQIKDFTQCQKTMSPG